jgi:hypothetical protein
MTVKTLQAATGGRPLWVLMYLRFAIEFIAAHASSTVARARFVINFGKNASSRPQRELGQLNEFGRRSEIRWQSEAGQQRGVRSEALAVSVAGCLGVFVEGRA